MTTTLEHGYRRFLLWTALVIYAGSAVELALVGHVESLYQCAPFGVLALGGAAVVWTLVSASARAVVAVRAAAAVSVAASLWGVVLHVQGNLAFEREVYPDAPLWGALWKAARGVSPLLAPGTLALAGILAAAATWRHPALRPVDGERQPAGAGGRR